MKKLFSFALVLAMVLMTPIGTYADTATAEVTAIREGDDSETDESPNTSDLSSISVYMLMLAVSGSAVLLIAERRKRHETD